MCDSIYMKCPELANPQRKKVDQWFPGTGKKGEWGVTAHVYEVSFGCDEVIWAQMVVIAVQFCEYTRNL